MSTGEERAAWRLPPEHEAFWNRAEISAGGVYLGLGEIWRRGKDVDSTLERIVLDHAVSLEAVCEDAIQDRRTLPLLPIKVEDADVAVRYDVQAAVYSVPRLVPFDSMDRFGLRQAVANRELVDHPVPALGLDVWHDWLQTPAQADLKPRLSPSIEGLLLRQAAMRLSDGLSGLLHR